MRTRQPAHAHALDALQGLVRTAYYATAQGHPDADENRTRDVAAPTRRRH